MSIFLESPVPIILIGIVTEAVLGAVLVRTRRGMILWAMCLVLVLVGIGVLIERLIVTDNERIAETLDGAADGLQANDLERVLAYISPSAVTTRGDAAMVRNWVEFTSVSLRGLRIGPINRLTSPPSVETRFTGVFAFHDTRGVHPYEHHVADFVVNLRLEGDRWLIGDYRILDGNGIPGRAR